MIVALSDHDPLQEERNCEKKDRHHLEGETRLIRRR